MNQYTRDNALLTLLVSADITSYELKNGIPVGGMAAQLKNRPAEDDPQPVREEKIKNSQGAVRAIWVDKLRERLQGLIFYDDNGNQILYDSYRQSWVATTEPEYVQAGKEPLVAELDRTAADLKGMLMPLQAASPQPSITPRRRDGAPQPGGSWLPNGTSGRRSSIDSRRSSRAWHSPTMRGIRGIIGVAIRAPSYRWEV